METRSHKSGEKEGVVVYVGEYEISRVRRTPALLEASRSDASVDQLSTLRACGKSSSRKPAKSLHSNG